jgi:hypothetical protein
MNRVPRQHLEWLRDRVVPMMRFIGHLRKRLEQRGYHKEHTLYQAVCRAYDALYSLRVTAHYEACDRGVGKRPNESGAGE